MTLRIHHYLPPGAIEGRSPLRRIATVLRLAANAEPAPGGIVATEVRLLYAGREWTVRQDARGTEVWATADGIGPQRTLDPRSLTRPDEPPMIPPRLAGVDDPSPRAEAPAPDERT